MTLKTLNFSARLAASFFVGSVIIGTVSSLIMLGLLLSESESGFVFPTLEGIRIKYAYPLIVTSMKTSMYEYVADDADIETVQKWIDEGAEEAFFKAEVLPIMKADCTKCHSISSTQTKAMPGMPLSKFEQVQPLTQAGYTDVTNIRGGFGGAKDRAGQVVVVGWEAAELPVERGTTTGATYDELAATK